MAHKETLSDILPLEEEYPTDSTDQERIRNVAVIGFGTMGEGIAQTISEKGLNVKIIENTSENLEQGMRSLNASMDREIAKWGMTESDKRAILSRIAGSLDLHDVEDADLVIEAITEDLEKKQKLFKDLDAISGPEVVLITNTSSLSITEIAAVTDRPERIIGMHFLNPVPKIPVVELVRGLRTSDETFNVVKQFAEAIDKTAIEVFETPGYVTTRVIIPLLNEAMHVLMEGVATAEGIDTAMKLGFNLNMGPLALSDHIGLDVVMTWMENLFHEYGESKYRPCPLLRKLVRAGNLGCKTGKGFFTYTSEGIEK